MKRALFGLALLLALPYACAPVYRFPAPVPFSGSHFHNPYTSLTGTWHRANLHAHGRAWLGLTSGRQVNEEVVRRYRALGYSVAGVSNYHEIAAHDGVSTLPLYEHGYNIGKHHQLAIGARRVEWLDFPVWQSRSHLQFIINRVAGTSDLVALVHPISRQAYSPEDVRHLTGYHAIEVVNGKFPHDDVWDAALSSGHPVWGIGNDDTHDLDDRERLGVGWTMIDAASPSTPDVVDALRRGRSYSVLRTNETAKETALGSVVMHGATLTVRVVGEPASFEFIGQNGRVRKSVEDVLEATYTFETDDTYIRPKILAPRTTMFLNPILRYDGVHLPWPTAEIDPARTWLLRGAMAAALIAVLARYRRRAIAAAPVVLLFATPAFAQSSSSSSSERLPVGTSYDADVLDDLPTGESLFAVLETLQPALIADRFTNGGLFTGQPARIGGFLASPTQTVYRIADVDITDPAAGGMPLLLPDLVLWDRVDVSTGLFPPAINAPGVGVTLHPRRPGATWTGMAVGSISHFGSLAGSPSVSPIAELNAWDRIGAVASGPLLADRVGIVAAGSFTRGSQFARGEADGFASTLASAFTHIVATPSASDEIRTVGWIQRAASPFAYRGPFGQPDASTANTTAHVQTAWERRGADALPWRLYGGYTHARRSPDANLASGAEIERLADGPVEELAWVGPGITAQWSVGAAIRPAGARLLGASHTVDAGAEFGGARATTSDFVDGVVRERVDGRPARTWVFSDPATGSKRRAMRMGLHGSDRLDFGSRLAVELGVRFDSLDASASGGAGDVRWRTWLPRARVRWGIAEFWEAAVFGGYGRFAHRLPLDFLAIGDPAAPTAAVYRWDGSNVLPASAGPAHMLMGPGTGGDPAFSAVDAALKRPVGDEVVVGFEMRPAGGLRLGLTGIARTERDLMALANIGAPPTSYSTRTFADPGADVLSSHDDVVVTAYDRLPATFGRDRYLLTNPAQEDPTFNGLEITVRYERARFLLFGGATASVARAQAASRGFGPLENDHARLGELFTNPNAGPAARGRVFTDRAYTAKLASIYRIRDDLRLGLIARYQDGQPFARMLVVPGLNQGVEAVRAFANGDSRFTYTASLDLRLRKRFTIAGRGLEALVDAYNALNLAKEVEEITTSAPGVRITSAVQPPRAIHLGVRLLFP